jgi:hypothetical protein
MLIRKNLNEVKTKLIKPYFFEFRRHICDLVPACIGSTMAALGLLCSGHDTDTFNGDRRTTNIKKPRIATRRLEDAEIFPPFAMGACCALRYVRLSKGCVKR